MSNRLIEYNNYIYMKRLLIFLILLTSMTDNLWSQKKSDANIFGHVVSKSTGEHLPFIYITIKGTTIGVATDATGHFFLKNLPTGNFTLVASAIGFKRQEIDFSISQNQTLEIDFELEDDAVMLDNLVVSATRNQTNRREAATIVNVINPKMFEVANAVCLSQGLSFQPGLRVETNCQNCGFQQVRINGLDGPYSQILIDSRPIFSSLAGVYGLEQIPANMIERVEVVRGGGSALFGSNAIAGTINIITKEPISNTITISNTTNIINGKSLDYNTSFNASLVSDNNKAGIMLFGSSRQRNPFDYDSDGFTEITKIDSKNIGFRAFYRTGFYSKLTFEYHNIGEFRRGGNLLKLPPHQADIAEQLNHSINTGGVKFDLFSKDYKHKMNTYISMQSIDRNSYYGANQDLNAYGYTDDFSLVTGAQYTYSSANFIFLPAEISTGIEYSINELKDRALGYNRILDQSVNTKSAYIQSEWKNSTWTFLLGSRLDKHSMVKNAIISPRANVRYSPNSNMSFRGSFATGFRAPQAFDEDLHITIAGGEASIIKLDPNLDTEKSYSISGSMDLNYSFGAVQTSMLIEGFYTRLDNVFILDEGDDDIFGNKTLIRKNGDGAIVQGINIEGIVVPSPKYQIQFGATIQKSRYTEPEKWSDDVEPQKRMFRTPDKYGYITSTYDINRDFKVSLSGTYTGSMLVKHYAGVIPKDTEKITPDFFDMNIRFAHTFPINGQLKMELNAGMQNIFNSYQKDFDKGPDRDAGYIYGPSLPRTIFFGVKFTL